VRSFATCSLWPPSKLPQLFPTENNMGGDSGAKASRVLLRNSRITPRPARITDEKPTCRYKSFSTEKGCCGLMYLGYAAKFI
jgi:hypothetical protein